MEEKKRKDPNLMQLSQYHHNMTFCSKDTDSKVMDLSKYCQSGTSLPLDLISEILERLPGKAILRFRCVCKQWNVLTHDNNFIVRHSQKNRNPEDFGIIALHRTCEDHRGYIIELSLHYFVNGHHEFDLSELCRPWTEMSYKMSNSCNGLICVYGTYATAVYLINPTIKEWLQLPNIPEMDCTEVLSVALVQDVSKGGECKIIRLIKAQYSSITRCQIYELGSYSWRSAQDVPLPIQRHCIPVVVKGVVYWLAGFSSGSQAIAVSFDIKTETFEVILLPEGFTYKGRMSLFELDGCVGLSIVKCDSKVVTSMKVESCRHAKFDCLCEFDGSLNFRVLEYYGNGVWKENHIRTNDPIPYDSYLEAYRDGKFLWWKASGAGEYYCHDIIRKSMKVLKHDFGSPPFCPYEESLISPTAIQLDLFDKSHQRFSNTKVLT